MDVAVAMATMSSGTDEPGKGGRGVGGKKESSEEESSGEESSDDNLDIHTAMTPAVRKEQTKKKRKRGGVKKQAKKKGAAAAAAAAGAVAEDGKKAFITPNPKKKKGNKSKKTVVEPKPGADLVVKFFVHPAVVPSHPKKGGSTTKKAKPAISSDNFLPAYFNYKSSTDPRGRVTTREMKWPYIKQCIDNYMKKEGFGDASGDERVPFSGIYHVRETKRHPSKGRGTSNTITIGNDAAEAQSIWSNAVANGCIKLAPNAKLENVDATNEDEVNACYLVEVDICVICLPKKSSPALVAAAKSIAAKQTEDKDGSGVTG